MPIIGDKNFETEVKEGVVIVKFYSMWDSSCRAFEDTFKRIANDFKGRAKFIESEINGNPYLAEDMGIRKVPTVAVFVNGKLITKIENVSSGRYIKEIIKKYIEEAERISKL